MTRKEYEDYQAAVKRFYADNIGDSNNGFSTIEYDSEPFFSWWPCDCCRCALGGDRYECTIAVADFSEILTGLSICMDCYYYSHYGRLDDTIMLELDSISVSV